MAHAKSDEVLFRFARPIGSNPSGSLVADKAGNLYGTTGGGGADGFGVVFELSPPAQGQTLWTQTVLHSFHGHDGQSPQVGLSIDDSGNLYGTTFYGGVSGPYGPGVVFELSPPSQGQTAWTETVVHPFDVADGSTPQGILFLDGAGNLYGNTTDGGANGQGVVYELSPPPAGQTAWTETILHNFKNKDGQAPLGSLIMDVAGNIYGTTALGGKYGKGVVYELSPPSEGQTAWTQTVLHSFHDLDGQRPYQGLVADSAGNFYGTTIDGGPNSCGEIQCGVAFKLSPPPPGQHAWTETVIAPFSSTTGGTSYGSLVH